MPDPSLVVFINEQTHQLGDRDRWVSVIELYGPLLMEILTGYRRAGYGCVACLEASSSRRRTAA